MLKFKRKLLIPITTLMVLFTSATWAITNGVPDCQDNANNIGCQHPNVVSLSGFKVDPDTEQLVSAVRCSGSVLKRTENMLIIITAGHCAQGYIDQLNSGTLVSLGVSFDALIEKNVDTPSVWGPSQYILGGKPLLYKQYAPSFNAFNVQYDYGLIAFPLVNGTGTTVGGEVVNVSSIQPVTLPPLGLANSFIHNVTLFTNVGYGTGSRFTESGKADKGSPSAPNYDTFGIRYVSTNTLFNGFSGKAQNLIKASMNPARGFNGTCGGDSGGPQFYNANGSELIISVTSSGDSVCRSTALNARLDISAAQNFMKQCAYDVSSISAFTSCSLGCTSLTKTGICPK